MGTITIKLNPSKMKNPDLDLRYLIPDRIEELTNGEIEDNGYDYLSDEHNSIVIFLLSKNPQDDVLKVIEILKTEEFLGNNIYKSGIIAIDTGDGYNVIHPNNYEGAFMS